MSLSVSNSSSSEDSFEHESPGYEGPGYEGPNYVSSKLQEELANRIEILVKENDERILTKIQQDDVYLGAM